jgi:hypothetical protein
MRWFLFFEIIFWGKDYRNWRTLSERNFFDTDYRIYGHGGDLRNGQAINNWLRETERKLYGRVFGGTYIDRCNQIDLPRGWWIRKLLKENS